MKKILISIYLILALFALVLYTSTAFQKNIHLVALGDSITYGTGDPLKLGYIGRFQQINDEKHLATIKIYNYGIPKYTTDDVLEQIQDQQVRTAIRTADYVTVFIGTNDFRKSAQYKFDKLNHQKMNSGKIHFIHNLEQIFTEIRKENDQASIIVFGLYHPYTQYRNRARIQRIIEEWNEEINQTAHQYQPSRFIPTMDLFLKQPKAHYYSDSIHLNSAGYELIANRLYKNMEIMLNMK